MLTHAQVNVDISAGAFIARGNLITVCLKFLGCPNDPTLLDPSRMVRPLPQGMSRASSLKQLRSPTASAFASSASSRASRSASSTAARSTRR